MISQAYQTGAPTVVLTFFPHPAAVLRGLSGPLYLTSPEEREELLGKLGVDAVVTLTFDRELAALTAEAFMRQLSARLGLKKLWVGPGFALGHNREGDVRTLERLGDQLGYSLEVIQPLRVDGHLLSSSSLRKALSAGDVDQVARGLGRWYILSGEVVHGDGRGHNLGIPTANLKIWSEQLIPGYGIYACWAWIDGQRWSAVTSIGVRPTFEPQPVTATIEAHLIDFNRNLYGKKLRLEFVARLRDELRYDSVEALIRQIKIDIKNAKGLLL